MKRRDPSRIAAWKWQPGQCPNPGGRPKRDLASEIAQAIFENNGEAIYKAFTKALLRGNAYAFKELSDRAWGRLKESHQVEINPYCDASTEEIQRRIKELESKLGISRSEPQLLPPAADGPKVQ